jgi:hypothetical protein
MNLRGVSRNGKHLVRKHGNVWRCVAQDTSRGGLWLLLVSELSGFRKWFFVTGRDEDFERVE